MKLKDLLKCPWQDIAKLSDKELEDICRPYFLITRPAEVARRREKENESGNVTDPIQRKALQQAASMRGNNGNQSSSPSKQAQRNALQQEALKKFQQLGLSIDGLGLEKKK